MDDKYSVKKVNFSELIVPGTKEIFPVGFSYIMGSSIYTVVESFTEDNTEMRKIKNSEGDMEIMTIASMIKDAEDPSFVKINNIEKKKNKK